MGRYTKDNCNDIYECIFTIEKCSYGLAESVENYKTVMFNHNSFNSTTIKINKMNNQFKYSIFIILIH